MAGPVFTQLGEDPNPKGPPPSVDFLTHGVSLALLGQDHFYSAPGQAPENIDWSLPRGPVFPFDLYTWIGTAVIESTYDVVVKQLSAQGGSYDPNVDPGPANPPAIFEPNTALTQGDPQLWIAASGGVNWGGALVSVSFDGVNYNYIGTITAPAYQGVLTAGLPYRGDPDTVDTLAIDLAESAGIFPTAATHADADAFRTLIWVCPQFTAVAPSNGELMSYGAVSATGTYTSNLTYLRRGLYGTAISAFALGSFFTRIDLGELNGPPNSIIACDLPSQYVGATVYVKLQSFNVFGNATEDIADVGEYSYTPTGQGYGNGNGGVPGTPTGLIGNYYSFGPLVTLSWLANAKTDNVTNYVVLRSTSIGGGYTVIGTPTNSVFIDYDISVGTTYYYKVEAQNVIGTSLPSSPVTVVT